ncbi:MAG TPA: hypothetical protein VMW41_04300 [Candidatus Bathyarchaeia archaeon]|nr:hypothetical protein [Candidatus Bathyarchaeia archaeon]
MVRVEVKGPGSEEERLKLPQDLMDGFRQLQERAAELGVPSDQRAVADYTYWVWCVSLYPEETARLIREEDLWHIIYTPGIAPAMRYENLLEPYLPESLLPLTIQVDDNFLREIEEDEDGAVSFVCELIKQRAREMYEALKAPNDSDWSEEFLSRMDLCNTDGRRPLAEGDLGELAKLITVGN